MDDVGLVVVRKSSSDVEAVRNCAVWNHKIVRNVDLVKEVTQLESFQTSLTIISNSSQLETPPQTPRNPNRPPQQHPRTTSS